MFFLKYYNIFSHFDFFKNLLVNKFKNSINKKTFVKKLN